MVAVVGFLVLLVFGPLIGAFWRLAGLIWGRDRTAESAEEVERCARRQASVLSIVRNVYLGYAALACGALWLVAKCQDAEEYTERSVFSERSRLRTAIFGAGTRQRVLHLPGFSRDRAGDRTLEIESYGEHPFCATVYFDKHDRVSGVALLER